MMEELKIKKNSLKRSQKYPNKRGIPPQATLTWVLYGSEIHFWY